MDTFPSIPILTTSTQRGADIQLTSTYDEIAALSQQVLDLLTQEKINLHRNSALGVLLREAKRQAATYSANEPLEDFAGLVRTAHANRVASAILGLGREPGARECLRRVASGTLDLSDRTTSHSKDALWEIELAYLFKRNRFKVEIAEPDLVINVSGERYPVACKKIYSEKGVEAQMRKGVKQLTKFGVPGLVAFNIDDLTPEHSIFISIDARVAGDHLANMNRDFIDRHRRVFDRYVADGRCHGVLVTTNVVADLQKAQQRLNTYAQTTIWTLSMPHTPKSQAFHLVVAQLQKSGSD